MKEIVYTSNKYAKEYTVKSARSKPPWYNNFLKNLKVKRDKIYQVYLKNKTPTNLQKFQSLRKRIKRLIKLSKKIYYDTLFRNSISDKGQFFSKSEWVDQ